MNTQPVDRNQFITQLFFNFSAAVLPKLVERKEFVELKDLNEEMCQAIDDLYERYKVMTGETVNLSVSGNPVVSFPPNMQQPRR